jgi:protein tyrosine phosphatase (PTP) superfamily phosphohydrolase (DUF442 family)
VGDGVRLFVSSHAFKGIYMKQTLVLIILSFSLIFAQVGNLVASEQDSIYDMSNVGKPLNNLVTGGQPSLDDLKKLAKNGIKLVINLRTEGEFELFDERKEVEALGMRYISIQVAGAEGINLDNVNALDRALNNLSEPTLLHCASSNRVGGLLAYRAYKLQQQSKQDALKLGKKAGMRSTAARVKSLIEERSEP